MPTIALVSPKGGAGKTIAAFLLATTLSKTYDVTLIDADPNHPIKTWAAGGKYAGEIEHSIRCERRFDYSSKSRMPHRRRHFVVVDLEGTASKIVVYAISQAHFVVIPT